MLLYNDDNNDVYKNEFYNCAVVKEIILYLFERKKYGPGQ